MLYFGNTLAQAFVRQHRTLSEPDNPICPTTDHALIHRRMAGCPDDLDVRRELGDVPHGVSRQDMGIEVHLALFRAARGPQRGH
jgi:hypothetical protein